MHRTCPQHCSQGLGFRACALFTPVHTYPTYHTPHTPHTYTNHTPHTHHTHTTHTPYTHHTHIHAGKGWCQFQTNVGARL